MAVSGEARGVRERSSTRRPLPLCSLPEYPGSSTCAWACSRSNKDIAAGGYTNAELAAEYNKAASTIYNIKVQCRDEIDEQRRKWTVQFEDLWSTRKQARLDDLLELRNLAWEQIGALIASCCVIDARTGEVTVQLIDERKLNVFGDIVFKANRAVAEDTGQLPERVEGLDQRWTPKMLGLSRSGIDYAAIARFAAQRKAEWEAAAPEREAAEAAGRWRPTNYGRR